MDDDLASLKRMTKWKAERRERGGFVSAADLRAEIEKAVLKPLAVMNKATAAWNEHAPPSLVARARPVALARGVLTIAASSSSARATLMAGLRGGLERQLKTADPSIVRVKVVTDATCRGRGFKSA